MAEQYLNKEEKEIVESLRHSDQNAFNALFRLYSEKVYRFSYGYLKSREEAEEIVQDTFIKIWENRISVNPSFSFSGYIFTIAHNLVLNRIRKIRNERACMIALEKNKISLRNQTEEWIFHADLEQMQQAALLELPPKRKIIFQMIRENGMTYQQVAEHLNISEKTVETQMTEALKHFRRKLSL